MRCLQRPALLAVQRPKMSSLRSVRWVCCMCCSGIIVQYVLCNLMRFKCPRFSASLWCHSVSPWVLQAGTDGAEEKDHGKGGKRKAGASLRQRLEKRLKSAREPGPAHSRPSRGFVFIK